MYETATWFLFCLTDRYAIFEGRAGRREYWFFTLGYLLVYLAACFLDWLLGLRLFGFGILRSLVFLALVAPGAAVGVRRLHDADRPGWLYLLAFVPLVHFYLLYLLCSDGTAGSNKYGGIAPEKRCGK